MNSEAGGSHPRDSKRWPILVGFEPPRSLGTCFPLSVDFTKIKMVICGAAFETPTMELDLRDSPAPILDLRAASHH